MHVCICVFIVDSGAADSYSIMNLHVSVSSLLIPVVLCLTPWVIWSALHVSVSSLLIPVVLCLTPRMIWSALHVSVSSFLIPVVLLLTLRSIGFSDIPVKKHGHQEKEMLKSPRKNLLQWNCSEEEALHIVFCVHAYLNVLCNSVGLVRIVSRLLHWSLNPCDCVSVWGWWTTRDFNVTMWGEWETQWCDTISAIRTLQDLEVLRLSVDPAFKTEGFACLTSLSRRSQEAVQICCECKGERNLSHFLCVFSGRAIQLFVVDCSTID